MNSESSVSMKKRLQMKWFTKLHLGQIFLQLAILAVAIIFFIPFYWMIITALKNSVEVNAIPPTLYVTQGFEWGNFAEALGRAPFDAFFKNTLIVGVLTTTGTLITTIFSAYAFARLEFKGREVIFLIFLSTMMVPGEMMMITNYITVAKLEWLNTYQALIFPFMVSTFHIFFLRNSIKQIPVELYKAAKVDGFTDIQFLFRVVVPIVKPTLITITILGLLGSWNAYVWPNLVTDNEMMRLVSNGLRTAFSDDGMRVAQNLQMAAAAVITLPILVVFLILKKYIVKGVSRSGIKG